MQINKLKQWIKSYGLQNVMLRGIYSKFPVILVDNNELLRRINWQLHAKKRLQKYLKIVGKKNIKENPYPRVIWWLWFQGSENAPIIAQKCLGSVRYYAKKMHFNLVELNNDNLFNYVNLPEEIIKKWKDGVIGNANFSDLCRVALLADYGGIWMDSTVFLTGPIDEEILEADLFFFKASFLDMTATKISNWFMATNMAGNPFLCSVRESMVNYWQQNNHIDDYFIFHLVVAALSEKDELKKKFDEIPFFTNTYPLMLGMELGSNYDQKRIKHIIKCSNIHKLTYKNLKNLPHTSVYEHFMVGGLEGER